jgi:preprotein translocase SecE subunit
MANLSNNKVVNFVKSVFTELRFVEFPTRKATIRLSTVVIMISILLGFALFLTDWSFQALRNIITSFKF